MKIFKYIGIGALSTLIILGLNSPVVEATIYISNSVEYRSGLQVDFDGVDEAGKSGGDPSFNTDTAGTIVCWINYDTTLSANALQPLFSLGGDDTDQATNFGRLVLGRRYAASIDNRFEVLHQIDNSATVNRLYGDTQMTGGTQYMLTGKSSGTKWKLFVNTTLQSFTVASGSNTGDWFGDVGTVGTRHASIGSSWRDGAWSTVYTDAKLDQCTVWSTELADADITTLYNGGKPVHPCHVNLCSNIQAHYMLGESESGTVTTMYDTIGTGTADNFTMENMENADIVKTSYY